MSFQRVAFSLIIASITLSGCSQTTALTEESSTPSPVWPAQFEEVQIPDPNGSTPQSAYVRKAMAPGQPLAVVLHTWSGDYTQRQNSLAEEVLEKDWNYIHPDFQGANRHPGACCSPQAIENIDAAIAFAIETTGADPERVYVLGASGGGYATLCHFMKGRLSVSSYSAWVPISDLPAWYEESLGRDNRYAEDILACTDSGAQLNQSEAMARSPLYMASPDKKLQTASLNLFAGIDDGYTGSVPISHSLRFYNKVLSDYAQDTRHQIADRDIETMIRTRQSPAIPLPVDSLGNRAILFERYRRNVRLVLFDGGHEMISDAALDQISWHSDRPQTILTIGDSNGASEEGWVNQLRMLRPEDRILNYSISGNTIGFDNLNNPELNTLRTIRRSLIDALDRLERDPVDEILINLGTNDSKAEFDHRRLEVPTNLLYLVDIIKSFPFQQVVPPRITIISPPPYGPDSAMIEKYHGGAERVEALLPTFETIATITKSGFIDIHTLLKEDYAVLAPDGVHMNAEGQLKIATAIDVYLTLQQNVE